MRIGVMEPTAAKVGKGAGRFNQWFGHWLAGFIDGEGSFQIMRRQYTYQGEVRYSYAPRFTIGMRADDRPVLEMIQEYLGYGTIYEERTARGTSNPAARLFVWRKAELLHLCRFLTNHPLHSKKARDFAIWKPAVQGWGYQRKRSGGGTISLSDAYESLREVRHFLSSVEQQTDSTESGA